MGERSTYSIRKLPFVTILGTWIQPRTNCRARLRASAECASARCMRMKLYLLTLRPRLLVGSSGSCTFTNLRWNARGPEGRSGRNCSSSGSTTLSSSSRPPSRSLMSTAVRIPTKTALLYGLTPMSNCSHLQAMKARPGARS